MQFTLDLLTYCSTVGDGLVAKSCPTLATPWTVAHQVPLSMGFSRQEYWSGLPFPTPGDLPEPTHWTHISYIAGRLFMTQPSGKSHCSSISLVKSALNTLISVWFVDLWHWWWQNVLLSLRRGDVLKLKAEINRWSLLLKSKNLRDTHACTHIENEEKKWIKGLETYCQGGTD